MKIFVPLPRSASSIVPPLSKDRQGILQDGFLLSALRILVFLKVL